MTELLSGDYKAAFGRSSHHQVWSEAMVATPLVRGLLGLTVEDGGRTLRFAPQLPADWDRVALRNVAAGADRLDLSMVRTQGRDEITVERQGGGAEPLRLLLAPSYPHDASIQAVEVDGQGARFGVERIGDVQRPGLEAALRNPRTRIVVRYEPGTEAWVRPVPAAAGARSGGLRILRARGEEGGLRLVLEGRGGSRYALGVRSPRRPRSVAGLTVRPAESGTWTVEVTFDGPSEGYLRREVVLPVR